MNMIKRREFDKLSVSVTLISIRCFFCLVDGCACLSVIGLAQPESLLVHLKLQH